MFPAAFCTQDSYHLADCTTTLVAYSSVLLRDLVLGSSQSMWRSPKGGCSAGPMCCRTSATQQSCLERRQAVHHAKQFVG